MKQNYPYRILVLSRWLGPFLLLVLSTFSVRAQVSGVVYRDFDLNGVRSDTLPIEVGIRDVSVQAFAGLSRTALTTTTNADGRFSFSSAQLPAGTPVRIEFSNLPTGDYEGPYGSGSGTRVQFITAGASATAINIGLNYPSDFCQGTDVKLATPCYVNGNSNLTDGIPPDEQTARVDALVSVAYTASGVASPTNFYPTHLASAGEIGATWGLAYQRRSKKLFSAAVLKRHTSYGPLGPGGIYVTDITSSTTGSFLDVSTIGIDVGSDSHSGLSGNKLLPNADPGPMTDVGKRSFGGMDMSEDDKTLYFVNLNDRKLYGLSLGVPARVPTAADVKSWTIPDPGCSNGDYRPWAVKMYRGKLYIGVVCSAETSQQQSDLNVTIYRMDPSVANPTFESVLAFPLNFRRGPADLTTDPLNPQNSCARYDRWLPWTSAWPTPCGAGTNPYFVMHPQPMITDIEFDDDGSMILGFLDRFGMLGGVQNHDPNGNGFYDGFTGGDILRAYNNNGTYELEKNGKVGGRTGSGVANNEGPVDASNTGGEFYGLDNWIFFGNVAHAEVTNGALSLIPGYNEVVTSAFDPIEGVFKAGGLKVFNNTTGQVNRNYVLYAQVPGLFGKASGLGDSKPLCDPAPVEIGNRVWFDDNRDGIQDAYEPGVDGIVLTLHDMENGGLEIASQTTRDGGQYYFNNRTVPAGIQFNHRYEVRMDLSQLPLLDITLKGARPISVAGGRLAARGGRQSAAVQRSYAISPLNRTDGNPDTDQRDSDALTTGSSAVIAVTTGDAGQNNFTFDLSMFSCPMLAPEKEAITVCSGTPVDSVAAYGLHLSQVDQVRFVLFTSPQSGTAMYSGGTVLGTVSATAGPGISTTALSASATADSIKRAVLYTPLINITNNTATPQTQYIYAIIFPTPEDPACRQSGETIVNVLPALKARATGATLSCSTTAVTLMGEALYGDDTPATSATFVWAGPGGFSSTAPNPTTDQPGMYTLTVGDGSCPASVSTATATVTADTSVPSLTATVTAPTCPTCLATISASAPGASVSWTGPDSYTSTAFVNEVTQPGVYTVKATAASGCSISASVEVVELGCPEPICVPIRATRIR
ncbi:SdrD B-like domain-containing protein [Spirosoma sordidisoli]|uniref:SD-repeat containing protein B domain-containing protein n=1 Tax=Spirosoma sordidisoli TaxID=2502893 RepID=A0A4Q2UW56_9BACT|nr:SdrD B-like domain-containing protein [Spirosoma sordidisoli]RYC72085.1 hypothetical protein EQG79_08200 [Spirosoma sordidisoli]